MATLDDMKEAVNMGRGVSALVLDNYQRITLARKHLWTWAQITAALHDEHPDLPVFSESAVQSSFKRIERGIKAKRIKPVGRVIDDQVKVPKQSAAEAAKPRQTLEIPRKEKAEYRTGAEIISKASNFETLS